MLEYHTFVSPVPYAVCRALTLFACQMPPLLLQLGLGLLVPVTAQVTVPLWSGC